MEELKRLPLAPIRTMNESTSLQLAKKIPLFKLDARSLGYKISYRHGTNIPGFGLISFQPRDYLNERNPKYGPEDFKEALHAQAIQSCFGWLLPKQRLKSKPRFKKTYYP